MAVERLCETEDCGNKQYRRGPLCRKHTAKANGWGKCAVDGCQGHVNAYGFCGRHAYRFKTHGDPLGGGKGSSPGEPLVWIKNHADYQGNDCIKWPFEITYHGYGTVKDQGKKRVASRVMCEVAHGDPPSDEFEAAHSCGNGHLACMNPRHLSWKTRKGNMRDAKRHGTWKRGHMDPNAKLSIEDVRSIRAMKGTMTYRKIGRKFGVSKSHVWKIMNRYEWAWLDD